MQWRGRHASITTELLLETVFSTRSVRIGYNEDNLGNPVSCQLRAELCTGGCEDRTWAREAEESPLLEAVVSERFLKTLQAGEDLACSDLWIVQISDSAVITYSS
jgi:hypothetical protein